MASFENYMWSGFLSFVGFLSYFSFDFLFMPGGEAAARGGGSCIEDTLPLPLPTFVHPGAAEAMESSLYFFCFFYSFIFLLFAARSW